MVDEDALSEIEPIDNNVSKYHEPMYSGDNKCFCLNDYTKNKKCVINIRCGHMGHRQCFLKHWAMGFKRNINPSKLPKCAYCNQYYHIQDLMYWGEYVKLTKTDPKKGPPVFDKDDEDLDESQTLLTDDIDGCQQPNSMAIVNTQDDLTIIRGMDDGFSNSSSEQEKVSRDNNSDNVQTTLTNDDKDLLENTPNNVRKKRKKEK